MSDLDYLDAPNYGVSCDIVEERQPWSEWDEEKCNLPSCQNVETCMTEDCTKTRFRVLIDNCGRQGEEFGVDACSVCKGFFSSLCHDFYDFRRSYNNFYCTNYYSWPRTTINRMVDLATGSSGYLASFGCYFSCNLLLP